MANKNALQNAFFNAISELAKEKEQQVNETYFENAKPELSTIQKTFVPIAQFASGINTLGSSLTKTITPEQVEANQIIQSQETSGIPEFLGNFALGGATFKASSLGISYLLKNKISSTLLKGLSTVAVDSTLNAVPISLTPTNDGKDVKIDKDAFLANELTMTGLALPFVAKDVVKVKPNIPKQTISTLGSKLNSLNKEDISNKAKTIFEDLKEKVKQRRESVFQEPTKDMIDFNANEKAIYNKFNLPNEVGSKEELFKDLKENPKKFLEKAKYILMHNNETYFDDIKIDKNQPTSGEIIKDGNKIILSINPNKIKNPDDLIDILDHEGTHNKTFENSNIEPTAALLHEFIAYSSNIIKDVEDGNIDKAKEKLKLFKQYSDNAEQYGYTKQDGKGLYDLLKTYIKEPTEKNKNKILGLITDINRNSKPQKDMIDFVNENPKYIKTELTEYDKKIRAKEFKQALKSGDTKYIKETLEDILDTNVPNFELGSKTEYKNGKLTIAKNSNLKTIVKKMDDIISTIKTNEQYEGKNVLSFVNRILNKKEPTKSDKKTIEKLKNDIIDMQNGKLQINEEKAKNNKFYNKYKKLSNEDIIDAYETIKAFTEGKPDINKDKLVKALHFYELHKKMRAFEKDSKTTLEGKTSLEPADRFENDILEQVLNKDFPYMDEKDKTTLVSLGREEGNVVNPKINKNKIYNDFVKKLNAFIFNDKDELGFTLKDKIRHRITEFYKEELKRKNKKLTNNQIEDILKKEKEKIDEIVKLGIQKHLNKIKDEFKEKPTEFAYFKVEPTGEVVIDRLNVSRLEKDIDTLKPQQALKDEILLSKLGRKESKIANTLENRVFYNRRKYKERVEKFIKNRLTSLYKEMVKLFKDEKLKKQKEELKKRTSIGSLETLKESYKKLANDLRKGNISLLEIMEPTEKTINLDKLYSIFAKYNNHKVKKEPIVDKKVITISRGLNKKTSEKAKSIREKLQKEKEELIKKQKQKERERKKEEFNELVNKLKETDYEYINKRYDLKTVYTENVRKKLKEAYYKIPSAISFFKEPRWKKIKYNESIAYENLKNNINKYGTTDMRKLTEVAGGSEDLHLLALIHETIHNINSDLPEEKVVKYANILMNKMLKDFPELKERWNLRKEFEDFLNLFVKRKRLKKEEKETLKNLYTMLLGFIYVNKDLKDILFGSQTLWSRVEAIEKSFKEKVLNTLYNEIKDTELYKKAKDYLEKDMPTAIKEILFEANILEPKESVKRLQELKERFLNGTNLFKSAGSKLIKELEKDYSRDELRTIIKSGLLQLKTIIKDLKGKDITTEELINLIKSGKYNLSKLNETQKRLIKASVEFRYTDGEKASEKIFSYETFKKNQRKIGLSFEDFTLFRARYIIEKNELLDKINKDSLKRFLNYHDEFLSEVLNAKTLILGYEPYIIKGLNRLKFAFTEKERTELKSKGFKEITEGLFVVPHNEEEFVSQLTISKSFNKRTGLNKIFNVNSKEYEEFLQSDLYKKNKDHLVTIHKDKNTVEIIYIPKKEHFKEIYFESEPTETLHQMLGSVIDKAMFKKLIKNKAYKESLKDIVSLEKKKGFVKATKEQQALLKSIFKDEINDLRLSKKKDIKVEFYVDKTYKNMLLYKHFEFKDEKLNTIYQIYTSLIKRLKGNTTYKSATAFTSAIFSGITGLVSLGVNPKYVPKLIMQTLKEWKEWRKFEDKFNEILYKQGYNKAREYLRTIKKSNVFAEIFYDGKIGNLSSDIEILFGSTKDERALYQGLKAIDKKYGTNNADKILKLIKTGLLDKETIIGQYLINYYSNIDLFTRASAYKYLKVNYGKEKAIEMINNLFVDFKKEPIGWIKDIENSGIPFLVFMLRMQGGVLKTIKEKPLTMGMIIGLYFMLADDKNDDYSKNGIRIDSWFLHRTLMDPLTFKLSVYNQIMHGHILKEVEQMILPKEYILIYKAIQNQEPTEVIGVYTK